MFKNYTSDNHVSWCFMITSINLIIWCSSIISVYLFSRYTIMTSDNHVSWCSIITLINLIFLMFNYYISLIIFLILNYYIRYFDLPDFKIIQQISLCSLHSIRYSDFPNEVVLKLMKSADVILEISLIFYFYSYFTFFFLDRSTCWTRPLRSVSNLSKDTIL